jgi:hypothetical protein
LTTIGASNALRSLPVVVSACVPGWLAECCVVRLLFGQDQFSGMSLAQQIVLTVMLDNDTAFCPEETFAVDPAIAGLRL